MLLMKKFGFALSKRHLIDSLCLRYGWELKNISPVSKFSVEHALSCLKGGFFVWTSQRNTRLHGFIVDRDL